MKPAHKPDRAWYREPWPWLLMSGPGIVLVGGAITTWIAFASSDGLVAEDYYKQGVAINRVIAREEAAHRRGISAQVSIAGERLAVRLEGDSPGEVVVQLAHATRAGYDRKLRLPRLQDGRYEAALPPLQPGRWHLVIEDPRGAWRIVQDLQPVQARRGP